MAVRLYIVPVVGIGTAQDPRRAKYFGDVIGINVPASMVDYGFEPWMVVGCDLSSADHTTLVANPDVSALPVDLTQTLTAGQVTATKAFLEVANLPAHWVTTILTWTQILRVVLGIFIFFQRFGLLYAQTNGSVPPSVFAGGVTLDSTFSSFPSAVRTALLATAQDQNISTIGMTGATTVRVILKALGDAYAQRSLELAGLVI